MYGGYSDSIVVDQRFVLKVPSNLDLAGTAPLLCAGITTFSPLQADATWARIRKEGNIVASVCDPEVFIRCPNGVACMTHSGKTCAVHMVAFQAIRPIYTETHGQRLSDSGNKNDPYGRHMSQNGESSYSWGLALR